VLVYILRRISLIPLTLFGIIAINFLIVAFALFLVVKGINRLLENSQGGFGGILFRAHEWATREQTLRSYELFARYVMPHFQGSLDTIVGSNSWSRENRKAVFGPTVAAVKKAFTDVGREVPDEFRQRTVGARDVSSD